MKWIPVLNILVWILSKIMTDDNKDGIPDVIQKKGCKKNEVQEEDEQSPEQKRLYPKG